ncbi:MAG TPA: glycosyltransferase family 39 protein [Oligoflexia bacterium]|nr:glycosyltransferase family 39 protein [Oligoflexia bacterium]HMP27376.1 glycosyltransferase family 39 protein [Oligoflexia bacterium]
MKERKFLPLLLVILLAILLRTHTIYSGMPFFYNEDEAHHFNRLARMAQSGDFNPRYFHKPSFNFYLRLPVFAGSFLFGASRGDLKSVKEIVTKDQFGIGGYAFSASHPLLVKINRSFSVLLSLLTILLCYLTAIELAGSKTIGIISALLLVLSPDFVANSAIIGVDAPMVFLVFATSFSAIKAHKKNSMGMLALCGVLAGLAISTKYNALPIAFVPLLLAALTPKKENKFLAFSLAIFSLGTAFLAGSPYILKELPLFLDQFAYEIWHYKIAGHVGHSAEPGLAQVLFYLKWLSFRGLGVAAVVFILLGVFILVRQFRRTPEMYLFLLFPTSYFVLMCAQKVNFERNMLVLLPYAAIVAALGFVDGVLNRAKQWNQKLIFAVAGLLLVAEPLIKTLADRRADLTRPESRMEALSFARAATKAEGRVSAAGQLWLPPDWSLGAKFSETNFNPADFYVAGANFILMPQRSLTAESFEPFYKIHSKIEGNQEKQRIVQNPAIAILKSQPLNKEIAARLDPFSNIDKLSEKLPKLEFVLDQGEKLLLIPKNLDEKEPYLWTTARLTKLDLAGINPLRELSVKLFSPFNQEIALIKLSSGEILENFAYKTPGKWQTFSWKLPQGGINLGGGFVLYNSKVNSPARLGINNDTRELGVAISEINFR